MRELLELSPNHASPNGNVRKQRCNRRVTLPVAFCAFCEGRIRKARPSATNKRWLVICLERPKVAIYMPIVMRSDSCPGRKTYNLIERKYQDDESTEAALE
jgi:hypothetical protein